jgi:hypothetical protein
MNKTKLGQKGESSKEIHRYKDENKIDGNSEGRSAQGSSGTQRSSATSNDVITKTIIDIKESKDLKNEYEIVLKDLEFSASSFVKCVLPTLQILENENNEIVEEIVYCVDRPEGEELKGDDVLMWLRNECLQELKDARKIIKEKPKLLKALQKGKDIDESIVSKDFPFLAKVWSGDLYDASELEALKVLSEELKTTKKSFSQRGIIEKGCKHFKQ